jgi:hypothetical protein
LPAPVIFDLSFHKYFTRAQSFESCQTGNIMMQERYETEFIFKYWLNFKNVLEDFIIIIIINTLIALTVEAIRHDNSFLLSFVVSQSSGVTVSSMVLFSLLIFRPQTWKSLLTIAVIDICLGVWIGLQMGIFILRHFFHIVLDLKIHGLGLTFITSGIILSSIIFYFLMHCCPE